MKNVLLKEHATEIALLIAILIIGVGSVIYGMITNNDYRVLAGCLPACISVLSLLHLVKDFYYKKSIEAHQALIESYKRLQVSYEEGAVIKDALIENYKELYLNAREQLTIYEAGESWQKAQKSTDAATI